MKKYKFITIRQEGGELFDGKPVYRIFSNKDDKQLGILSYYKGWKKYVFSTQADFVFDQVCLENVIDFMANHIKN